jgi:malonyl-CoA/methylmalonyl-CoA synthetase
MSPTSRAAQPPSEQAWAAHLPAGATVADLTADGSLPARWKRLWDEAPEAPAIVVADDPASPVLSRRDLDERSARAAGALADLGIGPGDRVLFSAVSSVPYLLLYVGALRLGAVVVPANTGYTRPELAHIATDAGIAAAVLDDPGRLADAEPPILVPGTFDPAAARPPAPALDAPDPSATAMIAYTSGTTGRPKGAALSHRNLLASAMAVVLAWRWTADDGLVLALPLFHLHGLGVGVNGALTAGGRLLIVPKFDADAISVVAARDDATMFFGVPTMYTRLAAVAQDAPRAREALASLRLMVSGSAPLSAELWERIHALTGHEILERYGMTETVMLVSNPYDGPRRPGSVGLPLPGVAVRLDDTAEILVKGPNVFGGYWHNDAATAASFTDDGFFRTGDIGAWDDDGHLAIVGRAKELIISGGYNVYPREVEEALESSPLVSAAAVFGVPSAEWGEEIAAAVVPADPAEAPTLEQLQQHSEPLLARYKRPRRLVVVPELPRNAMGKLARTELPSLL